ncbi:hypothetical protein C0992_008238 [Termitomyces sp. T32_za158]|nr:hypothetical protein C0992_008238 [Termitomyces sp. T32_za158]
MPPKKKSKGDESSARNRRGRGQTPKQTTSELKAKRGATMEVKGEEGGNGSNIKGPEIKFTWKLLAAITNDEKIKNGLYPPPGSNASMKDGGGMTKIEWHWRTAVAMFCNDEELGEQFKIAYKANKPENKKGCEAKKLATTLCQKCTDKIKAHLQNMKEKVQDYTKEMGETGAGLNYEEEVLDGTPLHNKWMAIKAADPWFFDMKRLLAERPNSKPVGLGNSETPIDLGVLSAAGVKGNLLNHIEDGLLDEAEIQKNEMGDEELEDTQEVDEQTNTLPSANTTSSAPLASSDNICIFSDSKDDNGLPAVPSLAIRKDSAYNSESKSATTTKRKAEEENVTSTTTKTAARAGSSRPVAPALSTAKYGKRLKLADEFVSVAQAEEATKQAEETTRQKELELAKKRLEVAGNIRIEREKAKAQAKLKKYELEMEKLRFKQQRRLARQSTGMVNITTTQPTPLSTPHTPTPHSHFPYSSPSSHAGSSSSFDAGMFGGHAGSGSDGPFEMYLPNSNSTNYNNLAE